MKRPMMLSTPPARKPTMRILEVNEARELLAKYPYLRASDIPVEGLVLVKESVIVNANREGEITVFSLDPNDT